MILFIDDQEWFVRPYLRAVTEKGLDAQHLDRVEGVAAFLTDTVQPPECIVLDVMFPGDYTLPGAMTSAGLTTGMPLFAALRARFPKTPVVILTASVDDAVRQFFDEQDHCSFCSKGHWLPEQLADLVLGLVEDRAGVLARELTACPRGRQHAAQFESLAVRIFTYLFVPPLKRVLAQSRRADGRIIRDAVMSNDAPDYFWSTLRRELDAKHIVIEFKNYAERVGRDEVRQLKDYLVPKTIGRLGLLVSRQAPSGAALVAQRDVFLHDTCLILFVDDACVAEMLELRRRGQDPATVLARMKAAFELET